MRPAPPVAAARSGPGTHRLSARDVDALSLGAIDPDIVRRLVDAEISYRRIAFRALLDFLRDQPAQSGPLTSAEVAWDLLVEVERRDPAAVRTVLDRPFAGAWAARLLRRLRARPHDDVPLWVDVGYLHAMAAAAAVRAGAAAAPTRLSLEDGARHCCRSSGRTRRLSGTTSRCVTR
ncbi:MULTISPECIES: HEXXH motif domain-containing protein [Protofrankia]|uniref:HEXXH motif domain-containing protein n=1 Tax=Protofrankia TaxID=2994361 RepID=UPI00069C26BD|nr:MULTISPECIES: HEXXH motif domain-containing protein [Protofrankia]ONH35515.1 hypothetical protein BL254_11250 [Protofrankia sp. BMG5.30]